MGLLSSDVAMDSVGPYVHGAWAAFGAVVGCPAFAAALSAMKVAAAALVIAVVRASHFHDWAYCDCGRG